MNKLQTIWDFFFNRWTETIMEEGRENWQCISIVHGDYSYTRNFVKYKLKNKFDGSEKIKVVYLN